MLELRASLDVILPQGSYRVSGTGDKGFQGIRGLKTKLPILKFLLELVLLLENRENSSPFLPFVHATD